MSQSQTKIDDQDSSRVQYNGTWIRGGSSNEYDGTVASSTRVGDSFTVSFTGTLIGVYGTIDATSGGVLTNYSVDGASPAQVSSQAGSGDTFKQQFWNSPTLDEGDHELLVTMVKVNPSSQANEGTIWFDYFLVTNPLIQSSNSTTKSRHVGAIVGSVVGGTFFLIFVVLGLIQILRCRNKRRSDLEHIKPWTPDKEVQSNVSFPSSHPTQAVEPFRAEANPAVSSATATHKPTLSITSLSTSPSSIITSPLTNVTSSGSNPVSSRKRQPDLTVPTVPASSSCLPEPAIQHVDSGVRVANLDPIQTRRNAQVELPPVYSPV